MLVGAKTVLLYNMSLTPNITLLSNVSFDQNDGIDRGLNGLAAYPVPTTPEPLDAAQLVLGVSMGPTVELFNITSLPEVQVGVLTL